MAGTLTISTLSDGTNSTSSTNCIQGSAKAWVSYSCATQTINSSYNVSSVTYNALSDFTVNFTTAFVDTNYCVTTGASSDYTTTRGVFLTLNRIASSGAYAAPTTTSIRVSAINDASGAYNVNYANIQVTR